MSIMGNVAGLGAVQPDWAQTDEKRADFIRNKPDLSGIEMDLAAVESLAGGALPKSGGKMTGAVNMNGKRLYGLASPSSDSDAVSKKYMEDYVGSKRLSGTVSLTTAWTNGEQEVSVSGILASDMPHWGIVYGTDREAEKEAFALIDELEAQAGKIVFRCFGGVPAVALTIQWEVDR